MVQGIFQEGGGSWYILRGGGAPRSNEISAKTRNVGPLKYTLGGSNELSTKMVKVGPLNYALAKMTTGLHPMSKPDIIYI